MSAGVRTGVFGASAAVLLGLLGWAIAGLPGFGNYPGPYGDVMNRASVPERNANNVVTAVTLDYRGLDTIGEEFILFTSVMAVTVLLRKQRREREQAPQDEAEGRRSPERDDALLVVGVGATAALVCFGVYIVAHGQLTPGGGFQGGAILASGLLVLYLVAGLRAFGRLGSGRLLEALEGVGAGGFVAVGVAGLAAGGAFLQNVMPLGERGSVDSAGTLPVSYLGVGLAVFAGLTLILVEFLLQLVVIRGDR
jgi:multicomponent Na+:H+ antiporter subunit B